MGKKKGFKLPAESYLSCAEPAVEAEAPPEAYPDDAPTPYDEPAAEAPTEEPPYDEPAPEAPTEEPPYDEPAPEAPLDEYYFGVPVRGITPVNPYGKSIIEAAPAEASSCDEPEKAKDAGSDFCVGITPKTNQSEPVEATLPSTLGGDDRHWEKLFVCCAQCTRMVFDYHWKGVPFRSTGSWQSYE